MLKQTIPLIGIVYLPIVELGNLRWSCYLSIGITINLVV